METQLVNGFGAPVPENSTYYFATEIQLDPFPCYKNWTVINYTTGQIVEQYQMYGIPTCDADMIGMEFMY